MNSDPSAPRRASLRVAAVQYQFRKVASFDAFARQVGYFVEAAAGYRAEVVVFPEFTSMQLLSQDALAGLSAAEGIAHLAGLEDAFLALVRGLAARFGVTILAGSHPIRRDGALFNVAPVVFADGRVEYQPKLHITPWEKQAWGITGGDSLRVFELGAMKFGVLVCYDSEFPEATRVLADAGIDLLFVPYCTDDRQAYARVRYCAHARAIENQIYVVTAGVTGNLPDVPAMDIHYARTATFSPSDLGFARDGIVAEADANVETLLVSELDLAALDRVRSTGSVTPRLDRRPDLFRLASSASPEGERLAYVRPVSAPDS